ncbi:MAG: hypothetical protein DRJ97_06040 [Thermoprotei archaeon]|nr:MAG: hypothetical protein DRJ97_06040 [Thermoprotei archaeon]
MSIDVKDLNAELLLHSLLFAYQKATREVLGPVSAIFVPPLLDAVRTISEAVGIDLVKGEDLDEVLQNYLGLLKDIGLVEGARLEKLGPNKYLLGIDKCIYAKAVHEALKPSGVTCLHGLIAMAIFEKLAGRKVKLNESRFLPEGSETVIEYME